MGILIFGSRISFRYGAPFAVLETIFFVHF